MLLTSLDIDQGSFISTMTSWRQPCMNVQEGEACGLLTTFCFVATMNFNHVVFELDCKIVIEKINTTCSDRGSDI